MKDGTDPVEQYERNRRARRQSRDGLQSRCFLLAVLVVVVRSGEKGGNLKVRSERCATIRRSREVEGEELESCAEDSEDEGDGVFWGRRIFVWG